MKTRLLFVFLLIAFAGWRAFDRYGSGTLRVTFFDVGQGDSVLIRLPWGTVWLIDAGGGWGDWDRGRRDLFLELARMGVLRLDVAVLSHPDSDHGLGFRGLLENIPVSEFRWNDAFRPSEHGLLRAVLPLAARQGARLKPDASSQSVSIDGVALEVWPLTACRSKNDRPLIVSLTWNGCRYFLSGDAEAKAENEIVARGVRSVDVMKVNHHGSRTSSTAAFVKALAPRWAVISAGRDNRYGHPAAEVTERFLRAGATVLRTDFHGFVEFEQKPDGSVHCRSALGGCGSVVCANR